MTNFSSVDLTLSEQELRYSQPCCTEAVAQTIARNEIVYCNFGTVGGNIALFPMLRLPELADHQRDVAGAHRTPGEEPTEKPRTFGLI